MLQVCASATSTGGLTTTARVRDALGTTASSDDAYQQDLVNRATDWAESHVGYPLRGPATYVETVAAYGRRTLQLSRTPIVGVLRLFNGTDTGTVTALQASDFRVEDAAAGLLSRAGGFAWSVALGPTAVDLGGMGLGLQADPDPAFGESKPWLVEYVAGWTLDGVDTGSKNWTTGSKTFGTTSTTRTLPFDVEQAVIQKAADWYSGASGVQSKKVGDLAITFASEGLGAATAEALLRPYRRLGP